MDSSYDKRQMANGKKKRRERSSFWPWFQLWQITNGKKREQKVVFDLVSVYDKWQMANGKKKKKKVVFDLDFGYDKWQMANGRKREY